MSKPDPDPEDTEEEPDIELADPDDYHRRQRLKEIHQARQRVHKVMDSFEDTQYISEGRQQRRELAYAVSMYVTELEPLIDDLDADVSLPDHWPWNDILQFADALGHYPKDSNPPEKPDKLKYQAKRDTIQVFRICNRVLADVKPLITDDETDEWEV